MTDAELAELEKAVRPLWVLSYQERGGPAVVLAYTTEESAQFALSIAPLAADCADCGSPKLSLYVPATETATLRQQRDDWAKQCKLASERNADLLASEATLRQRLETIEMERDAAVEVAIELYELGDSVVRLAEGAMSGNDHWCEQADRLQVLGESFARRLTPTPEGSENGD